MSSVLLLRYSSPSLYYNFIIILCRAVTFHHLHSFLKKNLYSLVYSFIFISKPCSVLLFPHHLASLSPHLCSSSSTIYTLCHSSVYKSLTQMRVTSGGGYVQRFKVSSVISCPAPYSFPDVCCHFDNFCLKSLHSSHIFFHLFINSALETFDPHHSQRGGGR